MSGSRGYFLGQVIDDLDAIAHQVDNRARLGFVDLNRMLEDFFKDVLNILLDANFRNLNAARSNAPGLDLGSDRLRMGVQVTSTATSAKVNNTLAKIGDDHLAAYDTLRVLVIGPKQGTYTLDPVGTKRTGFESAHIWDVGDLCRLATSLGVVKLQDLYRLVSTEVARVRVELELPRPDGKYPTGLDDYIEQVGRPTRSDASAFFASDAAEGGYGSREEAASDLDALADVLAELPRISREFFAMLVDKRERRDGFGASGYRTNADLVTRISRYPDTEGELRFLADRGFIDFDEPDDRGKSPYWRLGLPIGRRGGFFDEAFFSFLDNPGFDPKRVIVDLEFSVFGAPVAEGSPGAAEPVSRVRL